MSSLLEKLIAADRQLFHSVNSCHADFLDQPIFWISSDWFWLPLYLLFILLIIKKLNKSAPVAIGIIFVAVLLSDQGANLLKRSIKRPRPSHDSMLASSVHTINDYKGGAYGFVSSHAANTFCVALLISNFLALSPIFVALVFFWATLVSYSRIYLGVHFPLDVVCGAFLGLFVGSVSIEIWKWAKKRFDLK